MSTTIDSRVVEMRFDNKQFEDGVATTISTLEKFKQKLNLDGATRGLENVNTAANRVDMSGLGYAVETVGLKFNAMYTIADQALRNITNSAVNAGKRIASALTIEPIKTGLQEYETQINAVQTILANTESKGTTLKDVNSALDELNTYADKTIYNFTEMTRNIGTFTAAGVDLDTSVNAIQGIANLAAVSGSSSQQASTAMYQLSQAMASGTVKLMDWNSVVNAGMGGQVFQDALKETAKVHGVNVDKMIKKHGSFRETLQEGWITTDILTETLSHFTMAAEEGSAQWNEYKKSLMDSGYTEEQANAILKMSNTATDAATKVKTATQLYDTLKETAQSGWTQTWELIMGDFEEAKNLFSMLYETLAPIIDASSKARNDILKGWSDAGGRNDLIESLQNIFKAIGSIVKPIKDAFNDIFPASLDDKVKGLVNFTKGLKDFTEKLKLSDKASENLKRTFKGLFAIVDIVKTVFGAVFKAISPLFGTVDDLGGGILGVTAKIGDWLVRLNEAIESSKFFEVAVDKIHKAFEKIKNFLQPVVDGFKKLGDELSKSMTTIAGNAEKRFAPLTALGKFVMAVFVGIGNILKKVFPYVSSAAQAIGNVLGDLMSRISDSIQNADYDSFFDFTSGGIIAAIGIFITKFMKSGADLLDNAGGFVENIKGILEGVGDALGAFTDSLKADTLKKIATAIGILAVALLVLSLIPSEKLTTSLLAITALFGELMGFMAIFSKMGDMKGIGKAAMSIIGLSVGMVILASALTILSTMSWDEIARGLVAMAGSLGIIVGAIQLLPKDTALRTAGIMGLAASMVVLGLALKIMATMSWDEIGRGLAALGGSLVILSVGLHAMTAASSGAKAMLIAAPALIILGVALKILATMSWDDIGRGLVVLGGAMAILAVGMGAMISALPGAAAMLVAAPAIIILAASLKVLSTMSWDDIGRGLVALGGSLLILTVGLTAMIAALPGAAALLVAAAALAVLTPVLMALGSMSLTEIGTGLLAIAGVFVVLGLAALVLQPLVPTILALAGAVALLGVACIGIGAGVLMLGVGITALSAAVATGGGAIVVFVSSIISLIPFLIEQIGLGIIKLCETISGGAAAICEAVSVIIVAVINALVEAVPPLVEGLLVLITSLLESLITHLPTIVGQLATLMVSALTLLAEYAPAFVEALFVLIGVVLQAIAANITRIIEPLVSLVVAIVQGLVDIIGPIIQNVLAPIVQLITDILSGIATVINSVAYAIATALNGLANVFSSIFNGIATVISSVGDSIRTVLDGIAGTIDSIGTAIENSLNGLSGVFDSVFNGIATVIESVGNSIKSVLDGIAGVIDSIGEAALNAGTGFENLANGVKTITDLKLGDMVASLAAVAGGIGDIAAHSSGIAEVGNGMSKISGSAASAANGFNSVTTSISVMSSKLASVPNVLTNMVRTCMSVATSMKTVGSNILGNLVKGIDSQKKRLASTAKDAITQFINAIKSQEINANRACTALVASCASAISSKASSFESAGNDLGSGLVRGINAKQSAVYKAGYALGQKAVQGEKDGQKSKSPSKLTIQAGKWLGEGLVIGMEQMGDKVYRAGSALGESTIKSISGTISRVSDMISGDIDTQPTIRPVIDLSGVKSGASAISGMLNLDSQVGVRANISAISSMMSARGQNGSSADVVSAIDKLRKDIANIGGDTYQVNGVTYDDGSNINEAIKSIVRAARIERRV